MPAYYLIHDGTTGAINPVNFILCISCAFGIPLFLFLASQLHRGRRLVVIGKPWFLAVISAVFFLLSVPTLANEISQAAELKSWMQQGTVPVAEGKIEDLRDEARGRLISFRIGSQRFCFHPGVGGDHCFHGSGDLKNGKMVRVWYVSDCIARAAPKC